MVYSHAFGGVAVHWPAAPYEAVTQFGSEHPKAVADDDIVGS
jgi:hypothetical protein